jgi:hypothetical protein
MTENRGPLLSGKFKHEKQERVELSREGRERTVQPRLEVGNLVPHLLPRPSHLLSCVVA